MCVGAQWIRVLWLIFMSCYCADTDHSTVWARGCGCQSARALWCLRWSCQSTPSPAVRQTCWLQKIQGRSGQSGSLRSPPLCHIYFGGYRQSGYCDISLIPQRSDLSKTKLIWEPFLLLTCWLAHFHAFIWQIHTQWTQLNLFWPVCSSCFLCKLLCNPPAPHFFHLTLLGLINHTLVVIDDSSFLYPMLDPWLPVWLLCKRTDLQGGVFALL